MDKSFDIFNIGIGKGYTVLQILKIFESYLNIEIPHNFSNRRIGDSEICYSDNLKLKELLNFIPKHTIEETIFDIIKQYSLTILLYILEDINLQLYN